MSESTIDDVVWFWPVNDRAKVHVRIAPSMQSLCKRWMQGLGEDVADYRVDDESRPVCKTCLRQLAARA